jgi:hypothetical protein
MSAAIKRIAHQFIDAANKNPVRAPEILRHAAATFAGLATDPKNVRAARRLTAIGLDFAGAAAQAQEQAEQHATVNDFTQLLRDSQKAWDELGPDASFGTGAAMDAMAIQQGISQAQDPGMAPRVSIAPASFNKDTTLGRSATVAFAPTASQIQQGITESQTVAFWQGVKQEAQAMTIDFGTVLPPIIPFPSKTGPNPDARPYAQILYGSDGNTQNKAILDVNLGRRITVVGNYISVLVGMDPPFLDQAILTLGASIGAFAAPSQAPAIRTVYFDELGANTFSEPTPLPIRATQMLAPITSPDLGNFGVLFIRFTGLGGQIVGQWKWDYTTNTIPPPTPIMGDYYGFQLSYTVKATIRVPFQLSL